MLLIWFLTSKFKIHVKYNNNRIPFDFKIFVWYDYLKWRKKFLSNISFLPLQFIFSDIGKKSSVSENTIIFLCRKWSIFLRNSCKRDVNGRKYIPLSFQRISNWGQIYLFVICLYKGHNICCQMTQKRELKCINYRHQTIHPSSWHSVYDYFQWTWQVRI